MTTKQDDRKHVLFVCSRNQWRSPTAEQLFRNYPGISVRSAGTASSARHHLCEADIHWAHVIVFMESKHKSRALADHRHALAHKTLHVLEIPDEYRYMDPELVELLEQAVTPLLQGE